MDVTKLKFVFMGTPAFAVESLRVLWEAGLQVVAVVTAPDRPSGRGLTLKPSAVKEYAVEQGLPLLQPEKLKAPAFLEQLRSLEADLQIVVAFRMLPEVVWSMPPMGTINLHASLLPHYRGAAPINWALIRGESETGLTTFRLQHEIDTGDILMQEKMAIREDDDAGTLHDRMMSTGAQLLLQTVRGLAEGTLTPQPQSTHSLSSSERWQHAPKIFTETCRIPWEKTVKEVHNLVRGLSPVPGAFTTWNGKNLKIFSGEARPDDGSGEPGTWETDGKQYLQFRCADGFYRVNSLQPEGKRRMDIVEFLRGYRPV